MCSLRCNNISQSNCIIAPIPQPPLGAKETIRELQEVITPIFERTYKNVNPLGTVPLTFPKLTPEEQHEIETLQRRLENTPGWKEYKEQCKRWAILA